MSELAHEVASDIKLALDDDQLDLPSLPEVALEVRDVAESEHVSATKLASVVGKDPALATQLVRVANSPMFRATRSIDDLSQAISRLGVDYSANIVTGLAMQQMFQATSDFVDNKLRQIWKNTTEVAAWSSVLAKRFTRLRPDQATLAGLTHSIGVLPILSWVEEHDGVIRDGMTLDRVIESVHATIGTMILKKWNFAEEIVDVPMQYADLQRDVATADYSDLVGAAYLMSLTETNHPLMDTDWQKATCLQRVPVNPDLDDVETAELAEDVKEIVTVL